MLHHQYLASPNIWHRPPTSLIQFVNFRIPEKLEGTNGALKPRQAVMYRLGAFVPAVGEQSRTPKVLHERIAVAITSIVSNSSPFVLRNVSHTLRRNGTQQSPQTSSNTALYGLLSATPRDVISFAEMLRLSLPDIDEREGKRIAPLEGIRVLDMTRVLAGVSSSLHLREVVPIRKTSFELGLGESWEMHCEKEGDTDDRMLHSLIVRRFWVI